MAYTIENYLTNFNTRYKAANSYLLEVARDVTAGTITYQKSDGSEINLKVVRADANDDSKYNIILLTASVYGQEQNITSLRRHGWTDVDDVHYWDISDKAQAWQRAVFMRTNNKQYKTTQEMSDTYELYILARDINHVLDLGVNRCQRKDGWTNKAMEIKYTREQHVSNMKTLLELEELPQFINDEAKAIFGDNYANEIVIKRDMSQIDTEQYATYIDVKSTIRVHRTGVKPEDLESHHGTKYDLFYLVQKLRFDVDTCQFSEVPDEYYVRLSDIRENVTDTIELRQDIPYSQCNGSGLEDCKQRVHFQFTELLKMQKAVDIIKATV